MDESNLYKRLQRATPGFHWQRHEDKLVSGIPDCSYGFEGVCGWVELKTYDCWPRVASSPLAFTDLKPAQINWAIKRGRACGRVWFLVAIGEKDWFLISWKHARQLGKLTRQELLERSDAWGSLPLNEKILEVLSE